MLTNSLPIIVFFCPYYLHRGQKRYLQNSHTAFKQVIILKTQTGSLMVLFDVWQIIWYFYIFQFSHCLADSKAACASVYILLPLHLRVNNPSVRLRVQQHWCNTYGLISITVRSPHSFSIAYCDSTLTSALKNGWGLYHCIFGTLFAFRMLNLRSKRKKKWKLLASLA